MVMTTSADQPAPAGVTVLLSTDRPEAAEDLAAPLRFPGDFSITDQGIGIAPEHQSRIFERAVHGNEYGGLGMGLYIVRQIVEALGGTISVHSAPGAGATFTVQLPLQ